jgi:hypothetical protein
MADLSNKVALVYDYGDGIPLARRLAREFGEVLYFKPWKKSDPKSDELCVGDGFDDIKRVRNFFDHKVINRADLFIFPGIYDGDLQIDLINRGKRVWGSRKGERLEYDRVFFAETLEKVGLPVAPYVVCQGLDELEIYLSDNEDKWIKVQLRGDDETWHHDNIILTKRRLEMMRHKYGPIAHAITFCVFDSIDSIIEAAYDGFFVTSPSGKPQFSDFGFLGYENKNNSHILTAVPDDEFPEDIRNVNLQFAPSLAQYYVRSQFGTEIKKSEDGNDYFLDATMRAPSPPGEIIMEMVTNLGRVFYEGAEGEMVPLEMDNKVGVQVSLYSGMSMSNWATIQVPEEIDQWVKIIRCIHDGDNYQVVPREPVEDWPMDSEHIGDVVALGDTIEEAIELVKERCDMVKGMCLENKFDSLAEVLRRIKAGEKEGVEFPVESPEPITVLED